MLRRLLFLKLIIVFCPLVQASGLDLRLGNDAAQFGYLFDSGSQIGIGGADIGAAVFFNENDDVLISLGLMVTGSAAGQYRAFQFGAGARLYMADLELEPDSTGASPGEIARLRALEEDSVGAAAIGGMLSYIFPSSTPMAVSAELFFAPNIVSFGDNKDLVDIQLSFGVEIAPSTRIYFGYRNLDVDMEDSSVSYELDDSAHIGLKLAF